MNKILLIFAMLIISLSTVMAVAPTSVEITDPASSDHTIYSDDLTYDFEILVVDNDTASLNCTLYADYIHDYTGVPQIDDIIEDFENVVNNTATSQDIDFSYFQYTNYNTYNFTLSCTDGVDTVNSTERTNIVIRSFYIYDENDIAVATIETVGKTLVTISSFIVVFLIVTLIIWGTKSMDKRIGGFFK